MLKRTPLYQTQLDSGAKMIAFGDWELPVQYTQIIEEHTNTRENAGLFDVSHMGEFTAKGPGALDFINRLVTADISVLEDGGIKYSPMCYEDGGTVDDLLVYKKADGDYLIVVNASNADKDFEWMSARLVPGVDFKNISDQTGELAIQGPAARAIVASLAPDAGLDEIRRYHFKDGVTMCGMTCLISRTGYTGEDGYEIYCQMDRLVDLWKCLLEAGKASGLRPAGLGARDTLRFEACMPLYGHELSEKISPLAAGLVKSVALSKPDFIGKAALQKQSEEGCPEVRVGFEMIDKGIARAEYKVFTADGAAEIGFVTTGSYSPTTGKNLGMAMVRAAHAGVGSEIGIEVRGRVLKAKIVPMPFYALPRSK